MSARLRMSERRRVVACVIVGTLGCAVPAIGAACGACDEDMVAATYDHAVVSRAAAAGDVVVFCRIEGRFDGFRLSSVTRRIPGVRHASVRVSTELGALSFAVDSKRLSPREAVATAQHALRSNARLTIVSLVPAPS